VSDIPEPSKKPLKTSAVSSQWQVKIPAVVRAIIHLEKGTRLAWYLAEDHRIYVCPAVKGENQP